jgi:hypothetical protein
MDTFMLNAGTYTGKHDAMKTWKMHGDAEYNHGKPRARSWPLSAKRSHARAVPSCLFYIFSALPRLISIATLSPSIPFSDVSDTAVRAVSQGATLLIVSPSNRLTKWSRALEEPMLLS